MKITNLLDRTKVRIVESWTHRIQLGLNLMTLKLKDSEKEPDPKDEKETIVIPTTNHYNEICTRNGLDHPIKAKIRLRMKHLNLLFRMIDLVFKGEEPDEMTWLVKSWKSGNNYMYDALVIHNSQDLEMVKHMIQNGNVKPLYKRFKEMFK